MPYSSFGRIDVARDAAFVDLVEKTNVYTDEIKALLLEQAQKPCMNFSDRYYYPYNNIDSTWLYAEWLHRVLLTYDYVGRNNFTVSEQKIMDDWFKGAADWVNYMVSERTTDLIYLSRNGLPENYTVDFNYWLNKNGGKQVYKDSAIFYPPGSTHNNRKFGMLNFLVHAGVMYDNMEWKEEGAKSVREYISFHFDERGYYAELMRSDANHPGHGLAYGANTLVNVAEIARLLNEAGYVNLFEYESKATIDQVTGGVATGSVEKSLEWVMMKFKENFMDAGAQKIYPLENTDKSATQVIHFCLNEDSRVRDLAVRMYSSAAIINGYYNNDNIRKIYASETGNLCGVTNSNELRPGPNGIAPGFLFQYADVSPQSDNKQPIVATTTVTDVIHSVNASGATSNATNNTNVNSTTASNIATTTTGGATAISANDANNKRLENTNKLEDVNKSNNSSLAQLSRQAVIEAAASQLVDAEKKLASKVNRTLSNNLAGRLLLQVENHGEAWYLNPTNNLKYYLGTPAMAFSIMRSLGQGISNANLAKIKIADANLDNNPDTDNDGLSDVFEDAISSDKNKSDTDGDGYDDKIELVNGYDFNGKNKLIFDPVFAGNQQGKIFLQVEAHGEAWYVNPITKLRYYLGRPEDAYALMRNLSLGISNDNLRQIGVGELK